MPKEQRSTEENDTRVNGNGEADAQGERESDAPEAQEAGRVRASEESQSQPDGDGGERSARATETAQSADTAGEEPRARETGEEARSEQETAEVLAERLREAERRADEHWQQVLRARAELENLQKRSAKEVENAQKYALERFVSELLPIKDSMELGLSAARDQNADIAKVREGIELTLKLFRTAMEKFGIQEVEPARGAAFDPQYHEAMSTQEVEDVESGQVVMVVQKGYLLNERLVRPAMVIVAK